MLEAGAWQARAAHANAMARKLAARMPFPILHPVESNGVFVAWTSPHCAPARAGLVRLPLHRRLGPLHVLLGHHREAVEELAEALKQVA